MENTRVKELMTEEVVCAAANATLQEAAQKVKKVRLPRPV